MTIISDIPFQPITLEEVDELLQRKCPGMIGEHKERRDAAGTLRVTLLTYTTETHYVQVRNIIGQGLSYREVPIAALTGTSGRAS